MDVLESCGYQLSKLGTLADSGSLESLSCSWCVLQKITARHRVWEHERYHYLHFVSPTMLPSASSLFSDCDVMTQNHISLTQNGNIPHIFSWFLYTVFRCSRSPSHVQPQNAKQISRHGEWVPLFVNRNKLLLLCISNLQWAQHSKSIERLDFKRDAADAISKRLHALRLQDKLSD